MEHDSKPIKINQLWILILISDQANDLSLIRSCLPEYITDLHPQKLDHILTHQCSTPETVLDPSVTSMSVPDEIVLGWRSPATCHTLLQQLLTATPSQRTSSNPVDSIPSCAVTLLVKILDWKLTKSIWLTSIQKQYPDVSIIYLTEHLIEPNLPIQAIAKNQENDAQNLNPKRDTTDPTTTQNSWSKVLFSALPDHYEGDELGDPDPQVVDILPWESLQRADGSLLLTRSLRLAWQQMRSPLPRRLNGLINDSKASLPVAQETNGEDLPPQPSAPTPVILKTDASELGSWEGSGGLGDANHANGPASLPSNQDLPTLLFLAALSAIDAFPSNFSENFPESTHQNSRSNTLSISRNYSRKNQESRLSIDLPKNENLEENNLDEFNLNKCQSVRQKDRTDLTDLLDVSEYQISIRKLYQLLEEAPDGCLMIDDQGIVCYANPNALRLLNRDRDVVLGHHIGLPIVANQTTEIELIGRHGELNTAEMSMVSVTWNHGQGYAIVLRDISKHRQVESQLEYRLNLETALSNIFRMLATTDATLLEPILEQVGQTIQVNRVLLFWRSQPTSDRLQLACEWHSRTTPRLQDRLRSPSANLWSTWYHTLATGRDVIISSPEDWSDASAMECEWLQALHLATALLSPIRDRHGQLIGILLVGTQTQHSVRRWMDADRQLLQLVGQGLCAYQERQQVQDDLRASESLYASIFNHSAEYIFLIKVTLEGDFIFETINPAFETAIGKSIQDIQGKKTEEIFDQSYAQTSIARYRACVAGRSKITYEENICLAGETRVWRTGLVPIFNTWNQVDRLQGSSRDITSEYWFLDQQQQQRRYLQLLASLSLKIRKAFTFNDILSLTVGELQRTLKTGRVFFVEICPDGSGKIRGDTCKSKYQSSQENQSEIYSLTLNLSQYMNGDTLTQYRKSWNEMSVERSAKYSQNTDSNLNHSDFIQENQNQNNLHNSSARLSTMNKRENDHEVLEDTSDPDPNSIHQASVSTASYTTSHWMMPQSQLIVPVLISRSAAQTINRGYVPSSTSKNVNSYDQDSGLIGLLGLQEFEEPRVWTSFEQELLRQLATQLGLALHQAQLLEERADYIEKLARSNEDLEQFAYVVSHDLQEPLRGAIGFSELLMEDYGHQLDEVGHEYIRFILDSSLRMRQLIRDLLMLSRVGTHGHVLKNTNCDLVLADVFHNLHVAIEEANAEIIVPPLPVVWGDHLQLVQLFQNLLGNALKFRSDRPLRIQIQVSQHDENQWLFCVSDNGIGFDQHHEDRVFQVFQRLHDRETYEGTGMGLTICRKIVERHHGSIWVESQLNQGSTFYVTLPIGQADQKAASLESS
jgi:PAS domain S-box-containing protein